MKVCYFTSKIASDTRVFEKECTSLAKAGYEVSLLSPNAQDATRNGVRILGVSYTRRGALSRLFLLPWLLYRRAVELDADIYHFHDPASLPYALLLKWRGKRVVFDSFEDHPALLMEHHEIPLLLRRILARVYAVVERAVCGELDATISCYHWTHERLGAVCRNSELIFNFPVVTGAQSEIVPGPSEVRRAVCYAGLISDMWNLDKVVLAVAANADVRLILAGHGSAEVVERLKSLPGWSNVEFLGRLPREDVGPKVFSKAFAGIALLDYIPLCRGNVGNLSNNKLFEYMLAGLPVICTDFILWKEVVEGNDCGICVNANDTQAVAAAIRRLLDDPAEARRMGENGRRAVITTYNWSVEEAKLLNLYRKVAA